MTSVNVENIPYAILWFSIYPKDSTKDFTFILRNYGNCDDSGIICPFCSKTEYYSFQTGDYVSLIDETGDWIEENQGMLWCECDTRAVLILSEAEVILFENMTQRQQNAMETRMKQQDNNVFRFFKVPLAKVKKVYNWQSYACQCSNPDLIPTHEQLVQSRDCRMDYGHKRSPNFRFSLNVNSYNVSVPEIPYPDGFDTDHDGNFVYILCEDTKGKEFKFVYWGD